MTQPVTKASSDVAETGDALRLVGTHGSNRVMAGELSRLVRRAYNDVWVPVPKKDGPGSIVYPFDARMARVAIEYHRTSARVLWQVFSTQVTRLEPLYAELKASLLKRPPVWLFDGAGISVEAYHVEDFQAGERQIVGTVKNAVIDVAAELGLTLHIEPENPDLVIDVRGTEHGLVVSLDLSGRPMHQRGYRLTAGPAPLREDVAALLVMLMRHDSRQEPFMDPMAGAGTLGLEASLLAKGAPVWCAGRRPSGAHLPALQAALSEPLLPLFGDTEATLLLNEVDPDACTASEQNAEAAGVSPFSVRCGDFRELSLQYVREYCREQGKPGPGVILSNPPYGERLGDPRQLGALYRDLGKWCQQFPGWRAGFLVANPDFESAFGLRPVSKKPLFNGPLRAVFYQYQL